MEQYETLGKMGDHDLRRDGTVHRRSDKSSVKTKTGVTTKPMKQPSQRDETKERPNRRIVNVLDLASDETFSFVHYLDPSDGTGLPFRRIGEPFTNAEETSNPSQQQWVVYWAIPPDTVIKKCRTFASS